jgi:regulatory protein
VIENNVDEDSEHEACADVARKAVHKYARETDRATFQRKFGGFLQRRGFSFATIKPILAELWQETHDDALDE